MSREKKLKLKLKKNKNYYILEERNAMVVDKISKVSYIFDHVLEYKKIAKHWPYSRILRL